MLGRALPLAALLAVTGLTPAFAQMYTGAAGPPPMQPAPMQPMQQQEPPCFKDFMPLRQDAEKKAMAVRAAHEKKATPQEACQLIGAFSDAEAKVVKFVEINGTWCGIPAEAVKGMKVNHEHTLELRKQVCTAAANPPRPAGPTLSDALDPANISSEPPKKGRGTFDTLTGNVLAR